MSTYYWRLSETRSQNEIQICHGRYLMSSAFLKTSQCILEEPADENPSVELLDEHHVGILERVAPTRHAFRTFSTHMPEYADLPRAKGIYVVLK